MDFLYVLLMLLVIFGLYVWFVKPELLIIAYYRITVFMSGASMRRKMDKNGVTWGYLERGHPKAGYPSMLFIHGFPSRKEDWFPILMYLPSDQHIIVPDMPGHGDTDRVELEDDLFPLLTRKLHQFVELVGLDSHPFHLIGLSMGGSVTLCYSGTHPLCIAGASIICPAITTCECSEGRHEVDEEEINPYASVEGMKDMLRNAANRRMPLNDQIMKGLVAVNRKYADYFEAFGKILSVPKNRKAGLVAAERITSPSQVIWGADDKMLHMSGAQVLQEKLPNMKSLYIVPDCGHAVVLDKPREIAFILTEFHNTIKSVMDKEGIAWEYLENGELSSMDPSILLIHGFLGGKQNWGSIIEKLSREEHIVAVDIPGHGHTDTIELKDDIYPLLVQKFHQFVEATNLNSNKFHIVGYSLGGSIALSYAGTYPEHVAGASIICPAVGTPAIAIMAQERQEGKTSRFTGVTLEELQKVADRSEQIKRTMLSSNRSYQDFYIPLYEKLSTEENRQFAVKSAERITSPSQLIWGADDKMVHTTGAKVLQEKLPNMKSLNIVPCCNHGILGEKPTEVCLFISTFHKQLK